MFDSVLSVLLDPHLALYLIPIVVQDDLHENVWLDLAVEEFESVLIVNVLFSEGICEFYELVWFILYRGHRVFEASQRLTDLEIQLCLLI